QIRYQAPQLFALLLHRVVQIAELQGGLLWRLREFPAQHIKLDLKAQQGLQDTIVKVARNAAAFGLDRAGPQMAQQENIFKRRPQVSDNPFEPAEIAGRKSFARIDQQDAARRSPRRLYGDRQQRLGTELFPCGPWGRGNGADPFARPAIPAKAFALAVAELPAHGNFHAIGQEGIRTWQRKRFRGTLLALSRADIPHEQAIEILVADCQACPLAFECQTYFAERLAYGFSQSAIELQQPGNSFEEL